MAIVQILAARMAGVDCLWYHTFTKPGNDAVEKATTVLDNILNNLLEESDPGISLHKVFIEICELDYRFGFSDGN